MPILGFKEIHIAHFDSHSNSQDKFADDYIRIVEYKTRRAACDDCIIQTYTYTYR